MTINKSIPPKHISVIKDYLSSLDRPIVFKDISINEWEEQGRPYIIELVEQYDNAYCYLDSGYGLMLLIIEYKKGIQIRIGKNMCIIDNIVALDKTYFGTKSYIFKGNANHE